MEEGEAKANASSLRKLPIFYVWPVSNQLTDVGSMIGLCVSMGGNGGEGV
jgi:hypothetical protein